MVKGKKNLVVKN